MDIKVSAKADGAKTGAAARKEEKESPKKAQKEVDDGLSPRRKNSSSN